LLAYNPGTKPAPSSVLTYDIQDNSCHYQQWSSDVLRNRVMKADFYKKSPDFKKENPDTPWFTGLDANNDSNTRANTQDNKNIEILSVTPTRTLKFCPSHLLLKRLHFWIWLRKDKVITINSWNQ
jgi:hypothetical protein